MSDRQRLMRVTNKRQPTTPLDRELNQDVCLPPADRAGFANEDLISKTDGCQSWSVALWRTRRDACGELRPSDAS